MRLLAALLACLLACAAARSEEVELAASADPSGSVQVSAAITGVDRPRLLASLAEGLESSVTFEFRLYRRTTGLRALLGDRVVAQFKVERQASMDFLDGRYILLDMGAETRRHTAAEDFVQDFLTVRSLRLAWPADSRTYLIARARVEYVRLQAPLHIVTLFRPTSSVTAWQRVEIAGAGGQQP